MQELPIELEMSDIAYGLRRYNVAPEAVEKHKNWPFYLRVLASIKDKGMLNPIIVEETRANVTIHDKKYTILFGNNRFIAMQVLGYTTIKAFVKPRSINARKFKEMMQKPTDTDSIHQSELQCFNK